MCYWYIFQQKSQIILFINLKCIKYFTFQLNPNEKGFVSKDQGWCSQIMLYESFERVLPAETDVPIGIIPYIIVIGVKMMKPTKQPFVKHGNYKFHLLILILPYFCHKFLNRDKTLAKQNPSLVLHQSHWCN